jgi:hypothetical protein
VSEWVSEWVSERLLFNAKWALFKVTFWWDDDDVRFVLEQHADLDFYSASSLKQESADSHVVPLGHIILIPSQPGNIYKKILFYD